MDFYHNSRLPEYRAPFGAAAAGASVTLRADCDMPWGSRAYVRLWRDGELRLLMLPGPDGRYQCTVNLPDTPGLFWYRFELETPEGLFYYGKSGPGGAGALSREPAESWQITVYSPTELPRWYGRSVAYQIFPDRFRRGADWELCQKNAAHPEGWRGTKRLLAQDWNDAPFYVRDGDGRVTRWPFFGGNLNGVREKLQYLESLGVGVIYLNPIFLAASNHKYDTADYLQIDPGFGTEEDFARLCREAAEHGIRIILDGVFSHTGDDSVYFNRFGNYPAPGAYSDEESPYDGWYRFDGSRPCGYDCWWGVDSLPNVEETNPDYQELICGENGVIRKWLRLGASGWRLDVADELPDSFIQKIRAAAKAEKPDALILGEVWEDASNKISYDVRREYLLGAELDGTMHYPFRTGALEFLLGIRDARALAESLETIRENYPPPALYGALNLIGTHDTPRILTVLGEAPEGLSQAEQEQYRLPPERRERAKRLLKLLQTLQFASPGVPCVYYGDEAGMEGFADPFNRGTFPWGKEDGELAGWVRLLSGLRREYPVLVDGSAAYSAVDGDILRLDRALGDAQVSVYISRAWDHRAVPAGGKQWLDLLTGKVYGPEGEIPLPGLSALALYREGDDPKKFSPLPDAARIPGGTGLLCPVFSLPGQGETGNFSDALGFLDAVHRAGYDSWMLLPLCPAGVGNSPYSSTCVSALDPRYLAPGGAVDLGGYEEFLTENGWWLEDYALYAALQEHYGMPWQLWPRSARDRRDLPALKEQFAPRLEALRREQYALERQWAEVRRKAAELGVALIGDLPIYPALDSADAWANRAQLLLDGDGYPILRAGCPPDYFTPQGQDWGNPLYRWDAMASDGFLWWKRRFRRAFAQFDFVRLDHFRSFAAYYAIPAGRSAKEGHWMPGAGVRFFRAMAEEFGALPVLAEDLGQLDAQVYTLLAHTGLPGMNVWQFSERELNQTSPEQLKTRVLFSGTHDNQTLLGFLRGSGDPRDPEEILAGLRRMPAAAVIFQVQDVLGLGDEARINVPGAPEGNWVWRMTAEQEAAI